MPFRFIHTADVHLDSPLRSLALRDPRIAEMIGNATRQAFERIIELCIEERVDALMIVGDLFDGDLRSMKTAIFFGMQMRRLDEVGVCVFIVRGNHDAESTITKKLSLPDCVHLFTGRAQAVRMDEKDVVVHGVSFANRQAPESLLPKFKGPVPGLFNIGLMHTSLAGAEGHDDYAPCGLTDLVEHGFDYWALGHVHKRQVHAEDPCVVLMPGNPQGREINEAGARSVTLVSVAENGGVTLEERVTSIAQFERLPVDLAGVEEWREVVAAIESALGDARDLAQSDHLVARLEIVGETALAFKLRRDADLLLEEARQAAASLPKTAIEKVVIDVKNPAAPTGAAGPDPMIELGQVIATRVNDSESFRAAARAFVTDLQRQLPPSLRSLYGDTDEEIDAAVSRIITGGGEDVLARLKGPEPGS